MVFQETQQTALFAGARGERVALTPDEWDFYQKWHGGADVVKGNVSKLAWAKIFLPEVEITW